MADKRPHSKHATTSAMEPYKADEIAQSNDRRGLAQFEKQRPNEPASSRGQVRGNARWGGGGIESAPPRGLKPKEQPQRPVEDDDLRQDRMKARFSEEDDGEMAPVSGSLWGNMQAPTGAELARSRRGKPQPVEEEEVEAYEEEEVPPKKSRKGLWIALTVLLVGGGGAAAAVIATQGPPEPDPAVIAAQEEEAKKKAEAAERARKNKEEEDAAERERLRKEEEAKIAAAKAAQEKADAPKPAAEWAPLVEATNAWVAIGPAPEGTIIGISESEATDNLASLRTGFRPSAAVKAPTKGYKLSAHEVTWAEVNMATNIPELVTMERPKWLPKDVAKQAQLPVTNIAWSVARAFCQGMGGDLPSEAEWEWAARGAEGRFFPWGKSAIDNNQVRIFAGRPIPVAPVATMKLDKTPGETPLYDMLGNAQEWTRDGWRAPDAAVEGAVEDPKVKTHKAVRGWPLADRGASIPADGTTHRSAACAESSCMAAEAATLERIGFRCSKAE